MSMTILDKRIRNESIIDYGKEKQTQIQAFPSSWKSF
jgi:uncharacterized protein YaaN involved in tellurite resistance